MVPGRDSLDQVTGSLAATSLDRDHFTPIDDIGDEITTCTDFDRHGTRLCAGSADHRIRVFELNEETGENTLKDVWRAHNAYLYDVKWHPVKSYPGMIASCGDDLRLKIWVENPAEASNTGRRWRCVHSQSAAKNVVYESLSWACPPSITSNINTYSTVLAAVTRDGLLTLVEPVETPVGGSNPTVPAGPSGSKGATTEEWVEQDSLWIMGQPVGRGIATRFVVDFYQGDIAGTGYGPNYAAVEAGVDERALTLAVTAMDEVRVYRVLGNGPDGEGHYSFGQPEERPPVAELTATPGVMVEHIKWAPHGWKPRDRLLTAWADDMIRLYEIWTPEEDSGRIVDAPTKARSASTTTGKGPSGIGAGLAGAGKSANDRRFGPNQVLHRWELVAEIPQEGVKTVGWMREGANITAIGEDGILHVYQEDTNGKWTGLAQVGTEDEDFEATE